MNGISMRILFDGLCGFVAEEQDGQIKAMEPAFAMQRQAMQTFDINREPASVREMYGSSVFVTLRTPCTLRIRPICVFAVSIGLRHCVSHMVLSDGGTTTTAGFAVG